MSDSTPLLRLLSLGIPQDLAEKCLAADLPLSELRNVRKKDLKKHFHASEIDVLWEATKRKEIPLETIQELIKKSDWKCCICWNIDEIKPIVIHHIEEHSKTADDRYENLVVLCPTHHAIAHTKCDIARQPLPAEEVCQRKNDWEAAVNAFREGGPAPGRRGSGLPEDHPDRIALEYYRQIMDRRAMSDPFAIEGNMKHFLQAMEDIIRAFGTGILKTREGDEITRTKAHGRFNNPNWRSKIGLVVRRVEDILTRVQLAVRDGEMDLDQTSGFYDFHNRELPSEIDNLKNSVIQLMNAILAEAGLEPLRCVTEWNGRAPR